VNFNIDRAKTLFTRDQSDNAEWELALNNAIPFARDEFEKIVGDDELLRFLAMNENIPTSNFSQSNGFWSMTYNNDYAVLKVGEKIKSGSQEFKIDSVNGNIISGKGRFVGTPSQIQSMTLQTELNIFAYCVVAMVTKTASRLLMNTILPEQTQRGDDTSYRAYDPIKNYRENNLKIASEIYQNIKYIIEVKPEVSRLERA